MPRRLGLVLVGLGCSTDPAPGPGGETAAQPDTGSDTAAGFDRDGDGFLSWSATDDPAVADCDDTDPLVTPGTEVFVPAGPFTRGEAGVANAEPVRQITLSAYCIDRTEVTNAQFLTLLLEREALGRSNVDDADRPLFDVWDGDDEVPERLLDIEGGWSVQPGYEAHPVVEVWAWSAEFYCAQRGKVVPTEAQWEKAARGAVDERRFPWGDEPPDCERANFAPVPEGAAGEPELCVGDTAPVDAYATGASGSGVVGMAGNAAEWVSDWFDPDGYATDADTDPAGPAEGELYNDGVGEWIARVDRGGNHTSAAEWLGVSARFPEPEDATSNGVGFRCARLLTAP
ncbi:hypothetical protein LBMAG42_53290 [Deltaproteobacteria bacterium]|nr:hypothetical protein LBMAG42_53290 [Deltaproteobacteria bacterium]